jgi:Kef-type K+ transport system membrane component KefB
MWSGSARGAGPRPRVPLPRSGLCNSLIVDLGDVVEEEVPIQFFQSVIAIQLAVIGALLFQVRYFSPREKTWREDDRLPSATLRLAIAVVLAATLLGSLLAMLLGGDRTAAAALLIGLAVSILPILLRVLPPLQRDLQSDERPRYVVVTIVGVIVYVLLIAAAVSLIEL